MLRPLILVALLAAAPVLAGCITPANLDSSSGVADPALRDAVSEAVYAIAGHHEHKWTGSTGTQLYVDYYLPDVPEGEKVPVILTFTPYQRPDPQDVSPEASHAVFGHGFWAYSSRLVDYFVPRGYAVAFADVRGNHEAGGCIDQSGPGQWQDGYDYVEWLGTQAWSNGKVGMFGASYDGETQFTTAMLAPPHLATIVPVASVSNQYDWSFYEGVPYERQPTSGMASYFALSAVPSTDPADAPKYPEKLECQPEQWEAGLDYSGDHTPFWKERDYRPHAENITASVLHVHGLADWNVRPVHIDPIFNDITSVKRGLFGEWGHAYPDREDWEWILTAWYDHFLKGRNTGILDVLPPVLIEDSTGSWHGMDAFPPLHQEWLTLELSADGTLVTPGNASAGEVTLRDVPQEALTGAGHLPLAQAGVPTEFAWAWTTTGDLHLVGRPEVGFTAVTDAESTHWAVRLEVVGEDCTYSHNGREQSHRICENKGFQDTRHRDGFHDPKPLAPGEPYALTVRMYPQYDVIPAGSTVRLVVSMNDPEIQQDSTYATSTIRLGRDAPAVLRLPLSPGSVPLPADELPAVYPGYVE